MKGARMLIRVANNISKFPSRKYCLDRALCTLHTGAEACTPPTRHVHSPLCCETLYPQRPAVLYNYAH